MDRSLERKSSVKKEPFIRVVCNKAEFQISMYSGGNFEVVEEKVRPIYLKELDKLHNSPAFKAEMARASKQAYDDFADSLKQKGTEILKKAQMFGTKTEQSNNLEKSSSDEDLTPEIIDKLEKDILEKDIIKTEKDKQSNSDDEPIDKKSKKK